MLRICNFKRKGALYVSNFKSRCGQSIYETKHSDILRLPGIKYKTTSRKRIKEVKRAMKNGG